MNRDIPGREKLESQENSPKEQDDCLRTDVSPHHTHISDSNARIGSRLAAHLDISPFCAYRFISTRFLDYNGFLTCMAHRPAVPA